MANATRNIANHWHRLLCTKKEIDLGTLLTCGQSFTWRSTAENVWTNVINGRIFSVTQTENELYWYASITDHDLPDLPLDERASLGKSLVDEKPQLFNNKSYDNYEFKKSLCNDVNLHLPGKTKPDAMRRSMESERWSIHDDEKVIRDYFALDIDLIPLYAYWSERDTHFNEIAQSFGGIRILQQDPTENLFAFICSSNNHISRISSMVNKLSEHFGSKLGSVGGHNFYSFPTPERLSRPDVEVKLRELGFGYRAKFIVKTASTIYNERPVGWLNGLKSVQYRQCIEELMKLCGVGRKVADCVALMSLKKHHVVPVDTHVLQIAARDYRIPGVGKEIKSMTPALHDKISQFFMDLYGEYAGWAHTVLFAADLKRFSDRTEASKPKKTKSHQKLQEKQLPAKKLKKADIKSVPETGQVVEKLSSRLRVRKQV